MKLRTAKPSTATAILALEPKADGTLPSEFRLFVKGWNETENGSYLFDEAAAASVMESYKAWGVDLMIDLEHQALDAVASADPTARDARGWCNLELRDDGSLWAVNVKWTADGAARLTEKRQRYVSPAFGFETESRRVTNIINVAITAIPATHDTPELVAARRETKDARKLSAGLAFDAVRFAIEKALYARFGTPSDPYCCGASIWVCDVFDASVVYERDGKLFEIDYVLIGTTATLGAAPTEVIRSYTAAPTTTPAATPATTTNKRRRAKLAAGEKTMDPQLISKAVDALEANDAAAALEILKAILVKAAGGEAASDPGENAEPDPTATNAADGSATDGEDPKKDQAMAAARLAKSLTGKSDVAEAMAELGRRSKLALELEEREAKLSADREKLDAGERRRLVGQLVKLGVEIPATAWADEKGTVPCERLAKEPIESLRDRVAKLSAPGVIQRSASVEPPTTTPEATPSVAALTPEQKAICAELGCKPEDFVTLSRGAFGARS